MPAKLAIPNRVRIVVPTTYLNFSSTNQGYISSPTRLNGNGSVIIDATKLYFVALSVTFDQDVVLTPNNCVIPINTAQIQVFRNNNTILQSFKSFNENDENTLYTAGYINLNAGDVITAAISFANIPGREIRNINSTENEELQQTKIKGSASPFTVGPPKPLNLQEQEIIETRGNNNNFTVNVLSSPSATFLNIV